MQTRLQKGLKDDRVGLMKFVPDARALFKTGARKPRPFSWAISNLGVLDRAWNSQETSSEEDMWGIRRVLFTQSAHVPVAALLISAVSLKGGELVITYSWQDAAVEEALAECVVSDTRKWLLQIGR